ncbi:NAD(P)H-binding protein [Pedobacter namyangjuensis]|uniref:NAD(P)H-binding protein n=1 Tax=Pedobacter namyangjuensis TaxID=600626 RepID=UPI001F052E68|nr:NAD(P)H-binding protein [Pedobacter namyangjuensis]
MMSKKAVLIGATGLIGANLLKKLLANDNYEKVLVVTRKALDTSHPNLNQLVINFDELSKYEHEIVGDDIFCCLGTTAKKTPDKALYKKIDYQYPLDVAKIALKNGAKSYHLVSAMGANVKSSIFYNRTKGEVERDLAKLNFDSTHIYRPSLLDGSRSEQRFAEKTMNVIMRLINPLLIGSLKKYRSIKIEKVASAMLKQANKNLKGNYIYLSDEIENLGT